MKKLALSLCLLSFSAAYASESLVMEVPDSFWQSESRAKFEINKELGRAWVTLVTNENRGGSRRDRLERYERETRQTVPGLSYDAASRSIVFDHEGALHECASVTPRGRFIFRYDKITPTNCILKVKKAKKQYDDGYHIRKKDVIQVYLITK